VRIIASIEDPSLISKILAHLDEKEAAVGSAPKYIVPAFTPW
jgi:hypothetical protein